MDVIDEMFAYEIKEADPIVVKNVLAEKAFALSSTISSSSSEDLDMWTVLAKKYEHKGYTETVANGFTELDSKMQTMKDYTTKKCQPHPQTLSPTPLG
eukprot:6487058-Amphidinium_carterae.1